MFRIKRKEVPVVVEVKPYLGPKLPKVHADFKQLSKQLKYEAYLKRATKAEAEGIEIEPWEDIEKLEDEENLSGCESEVLLARKSPSFRCFAQVVMSSSSLLRSVGYNFPPVEDPGLEDALDYEDPPPLRDELSLEYFQDLCEEYGVICPRRIQRCFDEPVLNLKFYGIRKYQLKALCEALKTNRYIETLDLTYNFMTPQMCSYIGPMLEDNTTIKVLTLKCCNIGPLGAAELSPSWQLSAVTHLDLSQNNIGPEGAKKLRNIGKMESIQYLNLSNNKLTPESATAIEKIIFSSTTLEELDISFNLLGGDDGYDPIFNALGQTDRIRVFNMSHNGCCQDVTVFASITSYLQVATSLEHFNLSGNRIPAGRFIRELRKGIISNKSMITFDLSFNPWTPEQAIVLAQALVVSKTLQVLNMDNIWFTKKLKKVLMRAQLKNKTLIYGGIYADWEIKGPDWTRLLLNRIKAVYMLPKKKEYRRDFGKGLLLLPGGQMKKAAFEEIFMRNGYVEMYKDVDLIDAFYALYTKDLKLDADQMIKDYFTYFPEPEVQPVESSTLDLKKKKKRGSKGSKSSKMSVKKDKSKSQSAVALGSKENLEERHDSQTKRLSAQKQPEPLETIKE